jgi:hypothetical protein
MAPWQGNVGAESSSRRGKNEIRFHSSIAVKGNIHKKQKGKISMEYNSSLASCPRRKKRDTKKNSP